MPRHFGGSWRDVFENRWASAGGGLGLVASTLALAGLLALAGPSAEAAASSDDELEFIPGTIARLGTPDAANQGDGSHAPVAAPSAPTPAPIVEPVVEPSTSHATVDPTPSRPSRPKPHAGGGSSLPKPSGGGDLPGPPQQGGNPWGSKDGWDDLTRGGDAWATEVMRRLNAMVVRPFAGDPGPGVVRFQMTVCKDGKNTEMLRKGGDAAAGTHDAVAIAVEQLELPRIPPKLAAMMREPCMKIRYTFEWRRDRVE